MADNYVSRKRPPKNVKALEYVFIYQRWIAETGASYKPVLVFLSFGNTDDEIKSGLALAT